MRALDPDIKLARLQRPSGCKHCIKLFSSSWLSYLFYGLSVLNFFCYNEWQNHIFFRHGHMWLNMV